MDDRAERAHRELQERDPAEVVEPDDVVRAPVLELNDGPDGRTARIQERRFNIFVDRDLPASVSKRDTIRAKVYSFGARNKNAAHAMLLENLDADDHAE